MKQKLVYFLSILIFSISACSTQTIESTVEETNVEETIPVAVNEKQEESVAVPILDRIEKQEIMDAAIIKEMAGAYTVQSPLVLVDPYNVSPLTALVIFDTEENCTVTVEIPGKTMETTFTHKFDQLDIHHEIPIYALYPGIENQVEVRLDYEDGTMEEVIVPIETASLPDYLSPYEILVKKPSIAGGSEGELLFLAAATDTFYPFAIDKEGDVRWYSSTNTFAGGLMRRAENGKLLTLSDPMYAPAFIRPGFLQTDFLGRVWKEYLVDYTHHDVIELPNGNFLVSTIDPDTVINMGVITVGADVLLEIDHTDGTMIRSWNLNDICGYTVEDVANGQYLHTNSIFYNEVDDSIMFSSPNPMVVVKFDAKTNEIIWAIGNPNNYYPDLIKEKILIPIEADFLWNGSQHAATVLPNGNIMLFDNGSNRLDENKLPVSDEDNFSRLAIFEVDEENMTIRLEYSYGEDRGNDMYATYLGDVDYLGEDHYIINAGGRIIDPLTGLSKGSAFDVFMGISRGESSIIEIKDGEVVFEIYVGEDEENSYHNIYRVEWLKVYDTLEREYNLTAEKAIRMGELLPSKTVELNTKQGVEITEYKGAAKLWPVDYGYQLNIPLYVEGVEVSERVLIELVGKNSQFYYPTIGLDGAEGVVRKGGLLEDVYTINLIVQKKDGTVQRYESKYFWEIN